MKEHWSIRYEIDTLIIFLVEDFSDLIFFPCLLPRSHSRAQVLSEWEKGDKHDDYSL